MLEATAIPDHIHMLMIFDSHASLKYKYGSRHFWCRRYYADAVGRNEKAIREYIKNRTEKDHMSVQMSFKEFIDLFTGSKEKRLPLRRLKKCP